MIALHNQYDYEGSIKGIPELFEKITAKETGGIWLGSTPKNLGDVQLDENTFIDVKTFTSENNTQSILRKLILLAW